MSSSATPDVFIGADALGKLRERLEARGHRKVLVLTAARRRFEGELMAVLEGLDVAVFDGARAHVPVDVVEAASARLREVEPDVLVSLGGGAATGLGKALRLETEAEFYAVPTTYSGSEMTRIYATTDGGNKKTGRDDRVRPEAVFYIPAFTAPLSRKLSVQSLLNAAAHPISALDAGSLAEEDRVLALEAVQDVLGAALRLAESPTSVDARAEAVRGSVKAGQVLDRAQLGLHHKLAHFLGGRFELEHAALHALLLPHTVGRIALEQPELYAKLEAAAGVPDVPGQLHRLLERVGAPTALHALGVSAAVLGEALQDSELPVDDLGSALHGRNPSVLHRHEDWGLREPVTVSGAPLDEAELVLVSVHGRGTSAEAIVQRAREIVGHDPEIAHVAPQAPNRAWYQEPYRAEGVFAATALEELDAVVERIQAQAPDAEVAVFGFSQGACVAAEWLAQGGRVDALVALSGARIGPQSEYGPAPGDLEGIRIVLGGAEDDEWVDMDDVDASATWFEAGGADVVVVRDTGAAHRLSVRGRLAAFEALLGVSPFDGDFGFGNVHQTEALDGALPRRMNSPRRVRYGLYAEQINGSGFVATRHDNHRAWTYRVRPAAQHDAFSLLEGSLVTAELEADDPNLIGYRPLDLPREPTDFVDGLKTFGGAGHPELRRGFALHLYVANRSMDDRALYDADGDLLIVPQQGELTLMTEMGALSLPPGKVAIIPRGIRFSVLLEDEEARGYVAEVYGRHFELPERGPVGANGLTEARHFQVPAAWYEDRLAPGYRIVGKFNGRLYEARQDYSPYDVVAWHGNYAPHAYDLMDFSPVSNVRFDHPDPSIYTVLSAPMDEQGSHTLDFVFFPPRWDVTEGTFRPPFFHRNATTEFNGIIRGEDSGRGPFHSGGYFVTPAMTPHGVLAPAVQRMFLADEDPPAHRMTEDSLWFQFESALPIRLTAWARSSDNRIGDWTEVWGAYRTHFDPRG